MRALAALLFVVGVAAVGAMSCVKTNAFKCDGNDSACGNGGICEADGFCSVASSRCGDGGREYSDTAGDLAGTCVGGGPPPDGPPDPDGPLPDGPQPDTPPQGCDVSYQTLGAGQAGHKYKLITTPRKWIDQFNVCNGEGAFLAFPDAAAELAAIFGIDGNTTEIWIGVGDRAMEGNIIDSLGNPYTAITPTGQGNNEDCVTTSDGIDFVLKKCGDGGGSGNDTRPAVCECIE